MLNGNRVFLVLPALNASRTLLRTIEGVPEGIVDETLLVDDASADDTVELAARLGIHCLRHPSNRGYGANQKTCYREALLRRADIVVMLHPDYQYRPELVGALAWMVASGEYDLAIASRFLCSNPMHYGMPFYKYLSNRALTLMENIIIGKHLSEYHTGFRAFRADILRRLPLVENSDDFLFDNQILLQAVAHGYRIGEISCPARYLHDSSSITFRRSLAYGLGVVGCACAYRLHMWAMRRSRLFASDGRRLLEEAEDRLVESSCARSPE